MHYGGNAESGKLVITFWSDDIVTAQIAGCAARQFVQSDSFLPARGSSPSIPLGKLLMTYGRELHHRIKALDPTHKQCGEATQYHNSSGYMYRNIKKNNNLIRCSFRMGDMPYYTKKMIYSRHIINAYQIKHKKMLQKICINAMGKSCNLQSYDLLRIIFEYMPLSINGTIFLQLITYNAKFGCAYCCDYDSGNCYCAIKRY